MASVLHPLRTWTHPRQGIAHSAKRSWAFVKRNHHAQLAFALLCVLILGAPSLLYPFARDQGEYAYIAQAALSGKVVYRDIFNVKPPLTHMVHEMALLVFGQSMLSIRLLDLLWQGATAVVVLLVAMRLHKQAAVGLLAAFLYALTYYLFGFWDTAQTDGFLTLPVALGLLAFLVAEERNSRWLYVASGIGIGAAVLFKYPIGILLPLLASLVLVRRQWRGLRHAFDIALGFAIPLVICVAGLAREAALRDFLLVQLTYIPRYIGWDRGVGGYVARMLLQLAPLSWHNIASWSSAVALAYELQNAVRRKVLPEILPLGLWWLAALASYAAQGRGAEYHALPLLAPQSIILAHAAVASHQTTRGSPRRRLAIMGIGQVIVLAPLLGYVAMHYPSVEAAPLKVVLGRKSLQEAYEDPRFVVPHGPGVYSVRAQIAAARYIEAHSSEHDTVFVWGFEPTIYFLCQRACASRFIYNYPLYGRFDWPELREAFLEDVERNPPLYIVVVRNDAIPWVTGTLQDSRSALEELGAFQQMIRTQYKFERMVGNFTIYRRRAGD